MTRIDEIRAELRATYKEHGTPQSVAYRERIADLLAEVDRLERLRRHAYARDGWVAEDMEADARTMSMMNMDVAREKARADAAEARAERAEIVVEAARPVAEMGHVFVADAEILHYQKVKGHLRKAILAFDQNNEEEL